MGAGKRKTRAEHPVTVEGHTSRPDNDDIQGGVVPMLLHSIMKSDHKYLKRLGGNWGHPRKFAKKISHRRHRRHNEEKI